jgi:hypothetical protein
LSQSCGLESESWNWACCIVTSLKFVRNVL